MKKFFACLFSLFLIASLFALTANAAPNEPAFAISDITAAIEEEIVQDDVVHILLSLVDTLSSMLIFGVLVGAIILFFGYDIAKYVTPGAMLVLGFSLVLAAFSAADLLGAAADKGITYLCGLAVGFILLFLTKKFFKVGVFLCGLTGGFLCALLVLPKVWQNIGDVLLLVLCAAIGLALGVILQFGAVPAGILMLGTAIGGGYLVAQIIPLLPVENYAQPLFYIVWALCAIGGFIYQFCHCRKGYFYY